MPEPGSTRGWPPTGWCTSPGRTCAGRAAEYNIGPAAELLPRGGEVIGFCSWQEGLVLRPDLADDIAGVADVARRGLRLANREPGAEARSLLDRELAEAGIEPRQLPGYGTQATGHLQVAAAIAAGLADAGIASEPAALAYGLAFIPLAAEHFDLVIPAGQAASREVQGLLKVLSSRGCSISWPACPGMTRPGAGSASRRCRTRHQRTVNGVKQSPRPDTGTRRRWQSPRCRPGGGSTTSGIRCCMRAPVYPPARPPAPSARPVDQSGATAPAWYRDNSSERDHARNRGHERGRQGSRSSPDARWPDPISTGAKIAPPPIP